MLCAWQWTLVVQTIKRRQCPQVQISWKIPRFHRGQVDALLRSSRQCAEDASRAQCRKRRRHHEDDLERRAGRALSGPNGRIVSRPASFGRSAGGTRQSGNIEPVARSSSPPPSDERSPLSKRSCLRRICVYPGKGQRRTVGNDGRSFETSVGHRCFGWEKSCAKP